MEIKNLDKVAKRILKAVKNKEKIILYGDGDTDGIASTIILKEAILNLAGSVDKVYFVDREKEGYGLNKTALNSFKELDPGLIVLLDCGISNFEEVELAKRLGFEVIIIDHHEPLDKLPGASLISDPKLEPEKYQDFNFSTAGIIYKSVLLLFNENLEESLKNSFLELVALATIADMMPEAEENEIFIDQGLKSLENTWRPGLKALFETISKGRLITTREMAQKIIAALNCGMRENGEHETYLLLTASNLKDAKDLTDKLLARVYQKQIRIKEIVIEIEERILKEPESPVIFQGESSWPLVLAGPVASIICKKYHKPVFIFRKQEDNPGAARTPKDLNCVKAMLSCKDFLISFGGHPQAGGFRLNAENLEKLRECLIKYFTREL